MSDFRTLIRIIESSNLVRVYRGIGVDRSGLNTRYGVFFTDSRRIAQSYAREGVLEADLDISNAIRWTTETSLAFQRFVAYAEEVPRGAQAALTRYNRLNDVHFTMAKAIHYLLSQSAGELSHHELDPLMGFARTFIEEHDVIIRPHEYGGGMIDGTEYIVFAAKRIKLIK